MRDVLIQISENPIYALLMFFLAAFPVAVAALAINASRQFLFDRSREETQGYLPHIDELHLARRTWPLVSIIIPARNEQAHLGETIESALDINWPELEVIVINDGSVDRTQEIIESFSTDQRVRVITHK
jgi:cellulose synthase/poly-beta-1,6-N-acetylglucosamine synthase-like glycosyltransferase